MKHRLFLLCILFFTTENNAMKRRPSKALTGRSSKKQAIKKNKPIIADSYTFDNLPTDMQKIIINFAVTDLSTRKPKEACNALNRLGRTNTTLNAWINDPTFSDNLIKSFSKKFYCSHESIATFLHTKQSLWRLNLQNRLRPLYSWKNTKTIREELDKLIDYGINLDFTYNHRNLQQTPLMIAIKKESSMFNLLLKKGVDINTANINGLTALKVAVEGPIDIERITILLGKKTLTVNQQNRHGETALIHALIDRTRSDLNVSPVFRDTLTNLLQAGADPELEDNFGLTPLEAAKQLGDQLVMDIIKVAIDEKQAMQTN